MEQDNNEQTEMLRNIWNEMKSMNKSLSSRIDKTNDRLDKTNDRLETVRVELRSEISGLRVELRSEISGLREELTTRMTDSEIRLATATNELAGSVRALTNIVSEWRREHRASIGQMEGRVQKLEDWREQVESERR